MIVCPWKEIMRYEAVIPGLREAVEAVNAMETFEPGVYPLSNGKIIVQKPSVTRALETAKPEAHRQYLDLQYIFSGEEYVGWAPLDTLTPAGEFNVESDGGLYEGHSDPVKIRTGWCYVVYPEDAHAPGTHVDEPTEYQKLIIKLKV